jgi:hypothetical protein
MAIRFHYELSFDLGDSSDLKLIGRKIDEIRKTVDKIADIAAKNGGILTPTQQKDPAPSRMTQMPGWSSLKPQGRRNTWVSLTPAQREARIASMLASRKKTKASKK